MFGVTWLWYLIVSIPDLCTLTYLELKRRHGAIVVGLNNFSVILRRPVIIIHWSWTGLGRYVNRWLGDKKDMKVFGRTGVRIYHPPIKVRILRTRYRMRLAWRDLLHEAHLIIICQKRPKYGSASVARAAKFGLEIVVAYWFAFLVLVDGLVRSLHRLRSKSYHNFLR